MVRRNGQQGDSDGSVAGLIEQATKSSQVFPWSSGSAKTIAHLATIEGKPFVVQFSRETGELVTAFVPTQRQLKAMYRLLAMMK
jgi:hypothetical protein